MRDHRLKKTLPLKAANDAAQLEGKEKRTEGLPGVLGNKGTLAKYRREQGKIRQFLGPGEQNSKNYSTKTF